MGRVFSILKIVLRVFWIFPMNRKKVILTAYNGRQYSCSPKYLAEGLRNTGRYDVYYALRSDSGDKLPDGIKRVRYRSLGHFFHLMTAGFIIFNSGGFSNTLSYRKQQVVINTWHGGYSFKVIGNDIFKDERSIRSRARAGRILTYFLSGSDLATEQYTKAMSVPKEKFLTVGLPRNDILFRDHEEIRRKVFAAFGIEETAKVVLYAPTYRDGPVLSMMDYGFAQIDDEGVVRALEQRFGGKYVFVYKAHHDMVPTNIGENCINASAYSDIQELMCAADVIISDYSSCAADFALQRKIGFLYTPDLKEYQSVHPFSMEPEKWPYQTAEDNDALIGNILAYDEKAGREKLERFLNEIGNRDCGNAVDAVIAVMDRHRNQ